MAAQTPSKIIVKNGEYIMPRGVKPTPSARPLPAPKPIKTKK